MARSWSQHYWDLGRITAALSYHKHTLVSIDIGALYGARGPTNLLNVMGWPALHSIKLYWHSINFDATTAANTLLAPNLERLSLDYGTGDQHSESWSVLNAESANWCRDLMLMAAARKARLKQIHIQFRPEPWYGDEVVPEGPIERWPWGWLDDANEIVRREDSSMELTYSEPTTGRDDYYRLCRGELVFADYDEVSEEEDDDEGCLSGGEEDEGFGLFVSGPLTREETVRRERFESYFSINR